MSKNQKIYISGKITGNKSFEHEFNATERALRTKCPELEIVNPVRLCKASWCWMRCMAVCIKALISCSHICMIEGWQESKGARTELWIALLLGLEVWGSDTQGCDYAFIWTYRR